MTGFAFGCGVAPLAVASGASAKSQQALGTGVTGGMIAVVVLGLMLVPAFFVWVQSFSGAGSEVRRYGLRMQARRRAHRRRRAKLRAMATHD